MYPRIQRTLLLWNIVTSLPTQTCKHGLCCYSKCVCVCVRVRVCVWLACPVCINACMCPQGCFGQRMRAWQRWQEAQSALQRKREAEAKLLWANKPDKLQQAKEDITEVGPRPPFPGGRGPGLSGPGGSRQREREALMTSHCLKWALRGGFIWVGVGCQWKVLQTQVVPVVSFVCLFVVVVEETVIVIKEGVLPPSGILSQLCSR